MDIRTYFRKLRDDEIQRPDLILVGVGPLHVGIETWLNFVGQNWSLYSRVIQYSDLPGLIMDGNTRANNVFRVDDHNARKLTQLQGPQSLSDRKRTNLAAILEGYDTVHGLYYSISQSRVIAIRIKNNGKLTYNR